MSEATAEKSGNIDRELLIRMIGATIEASPIPLTAGSVLRLIERINGERIASRSTIQRILDSKAEAGEISIINETIEINGYIKQARKYKRKGNGEA